MPPSDAVLAHPVFSRFDPLPRILCRDDFDDGLCGWGGLIGNYEGSLDALLPEYRDLRPPMLSNLTVWDTGTYEKPLPGHQIQLDVKFLAPLGTRMRPYYQYTGIDDCTRIRVLKIYERSWWKRP